MLATTSNKTNAYFILQIWNIHNNLYWNITFS